MLPVHQSMTDADLLEAYAPPDAADPFVRFNFVSTLDGAATHGGTSGELGNEADQRIFALLRRFADVILVGAGTVRAEGYGGELLDGPAQDWRRARGLTAHPAVAVVSGSLGLEPDGPFLAECPVRPLILTGPEAPEARRRRLEDAADVVVLEPGTTAAAIVGALSACGHRVIHSEGGPHLLGTFVAGDAVDSLCLTLDPRLAGGPARRIAVGETEPDLRRMALHHLLTEDDALFLEYRRPAPDRRPR
ncbi:pyrimidine reductase family protein [Zhihengliuella sp.]|uniref:pyrimidine reductase family protein n=1 Tax=Zhihengliuella sp. TaxID=1954483 RepID=UPI002810F07F|nr:pyrimidine reductase family protein [Zhihengliuella sp.]